MKKHILSQSSFWIINKALVFKLGLDATLLLSELIYQQEKLKNDDFFSFYKEDIEEKTSLSPYKQGQAIGVLKHNNLIEVTKRGIPSTLYYKVKLPNINNLLDILHSQ